MGNEKEKVKCADLEGRGRGLVAARSLRGGEIILQESPMLLYVASSAALAFCSRCLRKCGTPNATCPGCRAATFCSSSCRSSHDAPLCAALRLVRSAALDDESENQARFLLAAYHLSLSSPSEFQRLLLLDGAATGCQPDGAVEELHSIVENAVRSWPWSSAQASPSLATTASLLVKEARNAFGLMAPNEVVGERSVRGFGIYPTASLINHDCLPNACRFDYLDSAGDSNLDVYIRALHDIPEKTEVTISYFPINWSFKDRQVRLTEEYGFHCVCERCIVEKGWSTDGEEEEEEEEEDEEEGEEGSPEESADSAGKNSDITGREKDTAVADGTKTHDEEGIGGQAGCPKPVSEADDFDHALFFVKYLCPVDGCGGTMAPTSAESPCQSLPVDDFLCVSMECNMCGKIRTAEEFQADLKEHSILE